MKKSEIEDLDIDEILEIAKKNTLRVKVLSTILLLIGVALAYLFRHVQGDDKFLILLGLQSQVIAFCAAILLSGQFLSIPERWSGVHSWALATAMSAPIYIYIGNLVYIFADVFLGLGTSDVWSNACMIVCFGLGLVLYCTGCLESGLGMNTKDKKAVVYTGWYMVVFSLLLQIYISLLNLGFAL